MPWTSETPLITAQNSLASAVCDAPSPGAGYRIYAIGGEDVSANPLATVEAYDTSAKTWSTVASLITARLDLAATSGPGRLYALGGYNGTAPVATLEIYDPAADAWSSGPSFPTPRASLAAATDRSGLIYAIGGLNGLAPTFLSTVEIFNPTTNSWTIGPSMPTPRSGLAAVTGPDGKIYCIGGQNSTTGILATVEIFDPATSLWSTGQSLPVPLYGLAAAVGPDGLIYAFGGVTGSGSLPGTAYSYNPATPSTPWAVQSSLSTACAFLAGCTGPDGLIYAIGGENSSETPITTVEALTVAAAQTAPDPYIGNGSYQSPDIVLMDSMNTVIPIGGAPGGAWDTLLLPNTNYTIQAIVYNDSNVAAVNTSVRFWHFPGGVGTAGAQIDQQIVTVPANGSYVVTSANPFQSGAAGQHECVAVSVANSASLYFNFDPTTATAVINPIIPHPAGSGHFGSAWRNTNSIVMPPGGMWRFPFRANLEGIEPARVKLTVTATKVPNDLDRAKEVAGLRKSLEFAGVQLRVPLFLVPEIRSRLAAADLGLKIQLPEGKREETCRPEGHQITVKPGEDAPFIVSATIPKDARSGDIFLVNVSANYTRTLRAKEAVVEYLEVIYTKK